MTSMHEILAGLDQLRRADPRRAVFGADSHQYRLEPRLDAAKLVAWERAHGVELPDEYRRFLSEVGNGGAGPFYGLFPLGLWDGAGADLEPWDDAVGDLRAPFPHRAAWNLPTDQLERPEELDSDDEEDAWREALDAAYYDPALLDGAFWICHHGCALRTVLVVTGPERGNVWFDGRANDSGIVPHTDARGVHLSFGDWYRAWLAQSLAELGR